MSTTLSGEQDGNHTLFLIKHHSLTTDQIVDRKKPSMAMVVAKCLAALAIGTAVMTLFPLYPVLASVERSSLRPLTTDDGRNIRNPAPYLSPAQPVSDEKAYEEVDVEFTARSVLPMSDRGSSEQYISDNARFSQTRGASSLPAHTASGHHVASNDMTKVTASSDALDQLYRTEKLVIRQLRRFLEMADQKLDLIDSYLDAYEQQQTEDNAPSNPVRDFVLLQRVEKFWNQLLELNDIVKPIHQIEKLMDSVPGPIPGQHEAIETISALIMSQEVYQLDIQQLIMGQVEGLPSGALLATEDLQKLADVSFSSGTFVMGLQWTEALQQYLVEHKLPSHTVTEQLSMRKQQHDELLHTSAKGYQLFQEPIGSTTVKDHVIKMQNLPGTESNPSADFASLCRGETWKGQHQTPVLYCQHSVPHPYYRLQPLKLEILHKDPYIAVYRKFLSPEISRQLIYTAKPKMRRSTVGPYGTTVWSRVSSTARLDHDVELVQQVEQRIQMATGLETRHRAGYRQEKLQVAEYGTAGFFSVHHDFFNMSLYGDNRTSSQQREKILYDAGERIATLMIYLSEVGRGGRTVFPQLGLSVFPEEGSAVFWYNVLDDGRLDSRTAHAGCPVLYGYKWIANKFVRDVAQTFTRPCSAT